MLQGWMGSKTFVSQLEWRPYGHLICTPVCLLAGAAFLNGLPLSEDFVRQIMSRSHNLFTECFASQNQPLKIQELYELIPAGQYKLQEAAGMLLTKEAPGSGADDLLVMPLAELLLTAMARGGEGGQCSAASCCCVIVTTMDHTICYLGDRVAQRLEVFDPLPASLSLLMPPHSDKAALETALMQRYGAQNASTLFSAVWLEHQTG
jgi:hypothetical protein